MLQIAAQRHEEHAIPKRLLVSCSREIFAAERGLLMLGRYGDVDVPWSSLPHRARKKIGVSLAKSFAQHSLCFPSQRRNPRNVEELPRHPIWFRSIVHNIAPITDHLRNDLS